MKFPNPAQGHGYDVDVHRLLGPVPSTRLRGPQVNGVHLGAADLDPPQVGCRYPDMRKEAPHLAGPKVRGFFLFAVNPPEAPRTGLLR